MKKDKKERKVRKILEDHYCDILKGRSLTKEEIEAEIANLKRKDKEGTLDDIYKFLYYSLLPYIEGE